MSTTTLTLSEFLLARIAEDEAAAKAVDLSPDTRGVYQRKMPNGLWERYTPDAAEFYVMRALTASEDGYPKNAQDGPATEFFQRHDPARVLAECEAKRRIIEEAEAADWVEDAYSPRPPEMHGYTIVRLLALPYADHPDYRQEWRP